MILKLNLFLASFPLAIGPCSISGGCWLDKWHCPPSIGKFRSSSFVPSHEINSQIQSVLWPKFLPNPLNDNPSNPSYCMASFKLPSSLSLIPSQLSKQSFLLQFWSLDLFCTLKEYPCHSDHLKAQVFVPHYFKQNSAVPTLLFLGKIQNPWLTRPFMMRPWLTFPALSSTSLAIILQFSYTSALRTGRLILPATGTIVSRQPSAVFPPQNYLSWREFSYTRSALSIPKLLLSNDGSTWSNKDLVPLSQLRTILRTTSASELLAFSHLIFLF